MMPVCRTPSTYRNHLGPWLYGDYDERMKKYKPALLLTCKQVSEEARYIPFSVNTLCFTQHSCIMRFVRKFEDKKGDHLAAVRSVRFEGLLDTYTAEKAIELLSTECTNIQSFQFYTTVYHSSSIKAPPLAQYEERSILHLARLQLNRVVTNMT